MRSLPGSSQDLLTSTLSAHRHLKSYTPKGHTWQPIVSRSAIQIWIRNEGWALNFSFAIETDGSGQRWQDTEVNSPSSSMPGIPVSKGLTTPPYITIRSWVCPPCSTGWSSREQRISPVGGLFRDPSPTQRQTGM